MKALYKSLNIALIVSIIIISSSNICRADWREGLRNFAIRIQSASKAAIDWGAEKFRPTFEKRVVPFSEKLNENIYQKGMEIYNDPKKAAKDIAIDESPLGLPAAAKDIKNKISEGQYREAAREGCETALTTPLPPGFGSALEPVAETICDEIVPGATTPAPTPLANMSLEQADSFVPSSVLGTVLLKKEILPNQYAPGGRVVRNEFGQPGQYGSYVEIHITKTGFNEEMTKEKFENIIGELVNSLNSQDNTCTIKTYHDYPVAVYNHTAGGGMTAFFMYSWFQFDVIVSGRYSSMSYIDAGIEALLSNLALVN